MAYQILNKKREWVKINNNYVLGSDFYGERKKVNLQERTLVLPGTDETKDRDGDIITFSGWNFDNLDKNPVFLWAHNYESVPLARITRVFKRTRTKRHEFQMQFPSERLNPFADMILALYNEKMINASSIGFIPLEWEDIEEKDAKDNAALNPWVVSPKKYLKKEALELSGCAIPCNPNTVMEAFPADMKFDGMTAEELIKAYMDGTLEIKHKDDILEELHVKEFVIEDDKTVIQGVDIVKDALDRADKNIPEYIVTGDGASKSITGGDKSIDVNNGYVEFNYNYKGNEYSITIADGTGKMDDVIGTPLADTISDIINERMDGSDEINKSGAVLNKKNLGLLQSSIENIQNVLDSAKKEEQNPVEEPDDNKKKESFEDLTIDHLEKFFKKWLTKLEKLRDDLKEKQLEKAVSDPLDVERKDANNNLDENDTEETVFDVILGETNKDKDQLEISEKSSNTNDIAVLKENLAIEELKDSIKELQKTIKAKL